ncbi:hypothetical protein AAFF_G00396230 [Aldrovandia affinis]|uniref:Uncharacterized protein n=1 Tax=Aldrovandia affinis TaxID=143900 RepID=A0AAD7WLJ0_9TELE|nr:hypothetical protein AAFF_G00396230 [Aldrovandia affinis]
MWGKSDVIGFSLGKSLCLPEKNRYCSCLQNLLQGCEEGDQQPCTNHMTQRDPCRDTKGKKHTYLSCCGEDDVENVV